MRDRVYSVVFLLSQAGLKAGLPRIFCSTTRVQIANTGHLKFWPMPWQGCSGRKLRCKELASPPALPDLGRRLLYNPQKVCWGIVLIHIWILPIFILVIGQATGEPKCIYPFIKVILPW